GGSRPLAARLDRHALGRIVAAPAASVDTAGGILFGRLNSGWLRGNWKLPPQGSDEQRPPDVPLGAPFLDPPRPAPRAERLPTAVDPDHHPRRGARWASGHGYSPSG